MATISPPNCYDFAKQATTYMQKHLNLKEIANPTTGGDYLTLTSSVHGNIGFFKVWLAEGNQVFQKMTYMRVHIAPIGLDANLFWAFTSRDSIVPHFTCHYNQNPGGNLNFHVDLLPKLDGVFHPEYLSQYYRPLSPSFHQAKDIVGFWARPSEHQYLMSGWGLYGDALEAKPMGELQKVIMDYVTHYCALTEFDLPNDKPNGEYLSKRHDLHLEKIFCRESDPDSYRIMDELLGKPMTDLMNKIHIKDGLPQ